MVFGYNLDPATQGPGTGQEMAINLSVAENKHAGWGFSTFPLVRFPTVRYPWVMGETKPIKTVRPDKKGRITLGPLLRGASSVRVSVDEHSRIILEPYAEVPLREAWLYENHDALEAVRRGLRESAEGDLHDLGSFAEPDGDDA